ncbi:glycosyltransferase [Micromonospora sp. NPDC049559]|uniref:glycosyltransferase n=1 Tax=Micromonospora sp. NPDC049559 TaxID=3155923 RepID=UPI00341AE837
MTSLRIAVMLKTNNGGLWILPQITELRRRGHHVIVVIPPGPGRLRSMLAEAGFEVVDSPFDFRYRPSLATLRGLWRLRRLVRRLRPDVLNYHLYSSALAARLIAIGLPMRRVHMVAGPLYLESPLIRPVERFLWRMDDVTICCTEHISRLYGELGCPPERRPVAQYGTDLDYFRPDWSTAPGPSAGVASPSAGVVGPSAGVAERRAKARAEVGVAEGDFLVVMVAYVYVPKRLAHNARGFKGHDVLLSAWPAFHARHPRSHLLLVGEGFTKEAEDYRQRLIDQFGVATNPSVTWLGWVPDLRPYFVAADVSVTPSLSEGSNGVVREASAMGVPTIASDAGGLPEAVDPSFGWIVPRGDSAALGAALEAAYQEFEAGRLADRGELARRHATRYFDRRAAARQVAGIVERAAGGARS